MTERYCQWGHWGIDFRVREGAAWGNPGRGVAFLPFPVGPRGPVDGALGSRQRNGYRQACIDWVHAGTLPEDARPIEN